MTRCLLCLSLGLLLGVAMAVAFVAGFWGVMTQ